MMKIKIIGVLLLSFALPAFAYDDTIVHRIINKSALKASMFEYYVNSNLGFFRGSADAIYGKQAQEWFQDGGTKEDETDCRSKYHFHDPTRSFDKAGLSNPAIDTACSNWGDGSSIIWSQFEGNDWSWQRARRFYGNSLTATDKDVRELLLANTFRAVGQVMHLLADSGVPEHVRNDIHIFPLMPNKDKTFPQIGMWTYETWSKINSSMLSTTAAAVDSSIIQRSQYASLVPISNLWDTTPEGGYNLNPIGLAEYTNLNYVSKDTIFNTYLYPEKNAMFTIEPIVTPSGISDMRIYYRGLSSDGITINHLASTGYLWQDLMAINPAGIDDSRLNLDDLCFRDYAEMLVPKAISYTAGLLDYFFRGQLGISFEAGGIRVKNVGKEALLSNSTGTESASIGIYYDDANGYRLPLTEKPFKLASSSTPVIAPGQMSELISFVTPTNNVKPNRYIIVYKGKLGNEEGAVVGRVYVPTVYYFSRQNNDDRIVRVDMDGGNPTIITRTGLSNVYVGRFSMSPDGNAIVFENLSQFDELNGNILHYDLLTKTITLLAEGNSPNWSPDGTKIVFSRELGRLGGIADSQLFTIDLSSRVETQLTDKLYTAHYDPAWSPDGSRIAFAYSNSQSPECGNIFTINVMTSSGESAMPITCTAGEVYVDRQPAWSPDGKEIVFVRRKERETASHIHKAIVAATPATITQLTSSPMAYTAPAWSPDGSAIAYSSAPTPDGNYDVYLIDAMTGNIINNLTAANPGSDGWPIFGN